MDLQKIRQLIQLVSESDLADFQLTEGSDFLRLRKFEQDTSAAPPPTVPQTSNAIQVALDSGTLPPSVLVQEDAKTTFRSPMSGTFYRATAPDEPALAEVGATVTVGTPLCVIEAMKLLNTVESDVDGQILEVLVENGEYVEQDAPLFRIA